MQRSRCPTYKKNRLPAKICKRFLATGRLPRLKKFTSVFQSKLKSDCKALLIIGLRMSIKSDNKSHYTRLANVVLDKVITVLSGDDL